MTYVNWIVSEQGSTMIVTINRANVLNALNRQTLLELEQILMDSSLRWNDIKAIVITGAGERSFVAGADISEMKNLTPMQAQELSALGNRVLDMIEHLPVPVIAAVNGFALGGGLELALACDFIYASENAILGLVEAKLGLIPGFGGVKRLVKRVGDACAREMIYSAAPIRADEALQIGLVSRVFPQAEVLNASVKKAEEISTRAPCAIKLVKDLIREGQTNDSQAFGLVFSTRDREIGINAFLDKTTPSFEGT